MSPENLNKIFKSYDVRGKVGSELTSGLVEKIGRAFADWLPAKGPVAVGRDMRPDSLELAQAFIEGLGKQGRDVWDIGLVTSDMIFFAVGKFNLAGGAVITASHNPGADNGIKLYRDRVIAVGLDSGLSNIRDIALGDRFKKVASPGRLETKAINDEWIRHCLGFAKHIKPFHVAIDTGNGMAGAILPHILPHLPIKVEAMYFELDGTFPNHGANPSLPQNLKDLIQKILAEKLDFGLAFDGDGDRVVFVDDKGRPVLGSDVISIAARYYLEKYPGAEIVHDVRTSRATQELIREWGGIPYRTKAGRVVIGTVMREHEAPFGGETSGHLFFKENYYADSGLIAALVVMQALSDGDKKLSELVDEYRLYAMITETNFEVADKETVLERLRAEFSDGKQDNLDGLTVNYPDKWFNLRPSNTESLLRLNAEAKNQKELDAFVARISKIIKSA